MWFYSVQSILVNTEESVFAGSRPAWACVVSQFPHIWLSDSLDFASLDSAARSQSLQPAANVTSPRSAMEKQRKTPQQSERKKNICFSGDN